MRQRHPTAAPDTTATAVTTVPTTTPPTTVLAVTVPPTTLPAVDRLTGYGATVAEWDTKHTKDRDYEGLPAYGPTLSTPEGPTPQYIGVQIDGHRVIQYIETLPSGTSLAEAKALVIPNLPPDAVAQSFVIDTTGSPDGQSCAFWNFDSAILRSDPNDFLFPEIAVELAYDNEVGAPYWRPNDINTLSFLQGVQSATDVC